MLKCESRISLHAVQCKGQPGPVLIFCSYYFKNGQSRHFVLMFCGTASLALFLACFLACSFFFFFFFFCCISPFYLLYLITIPQFYCIFLLSLLTSSDINLCIQHVYILFLMITQTVGKLYLDEIYQTSSNQHLVESRFHVFRWLL